MYQFIFEVVLHYMQSFETYSNFSVWMTHRVVYLIYKQLFLFITKLFVFLKTLAF